MEKFRLIQLLNRVETKINSTMLSNKRKEEINKMLLEIKEEAIDYTHCCKSDSEQLLAVAKYVYWNYDDSSTKNPEDYLKDFRSQ